MTRLITVHGMTTEYSRRHIISELEKLKSINKVSITLSTKLLQVTFDDTNITLNEIKKMVHNLGYEPLY